jgi:hypothetical protein
MEVQQSSSVLHQTLAHQVLTPRTEISHMLHSRRKAEIEIISSALKVASATDEPKHSFLQPHFKGGDAIANYPLVQYLIPKLNFWVKAC